jgi:hypothetical protein
MLSISREHIAARGADEIKQEMKTRSKMLF